MKPRLVLGRALSGAFDPPMQHLKDMHARAHTGGHAELNIYSVVSRRTPGRPWWRRST